MKKIIRSEIALGIIVAVAGTIALVISLLISNQDWNQAPVQLLAQKEDRQLGGKQFQEENSEDIRTLNAQLHLINYNLVDPLIEFNQKIDHWDTYNNNEFKFSVKYPNTFLAIPGNHGCGEIVSFMEFDANARSLFGKPNPGFFTRIVVYYWKDINDIYLKGGSWTDERKYENIEDLFSDINNPFVKKTGELVIDGKRAYRASVSGESVIDGVMFKHNNGYYRIEFPDAQRALADNIKEQFLSSFKLR